MKSYPQMIVAATGLICCFLLYTPRPTAIAAAPVRDAPATSSIADQDRVSGTVYRIGGDSLGSYRNGVDSVVSIVQSIGDWELDTKSSNLRKVRIDLGDQVPGSGPAPPFQSAVLPTRFISKCTEHVYPECRSNPCLPIGDEHRLQWDDVCLALGRADRARNRSSFVNM